MLEKLDISNLSFRLILVEDFRTIFCGTGIVTDMLLFDSELEQNIRFQQNYKVTLEIYNNMIVLLRFPTGYIVSHIFNMNLLLHSIFLECNLVKGYRFTH